MPTLEAQLDLDHWTFGLAWSLSLPSEPLLIESEAD